MSFFELLSSSNLAGEEVTGCNGFGHCDSSGGGLLWNWLGGVAFTLPISVALSREGWHPTSHRFAGWPGF